MTEQERVQAVVDYGFTARQAGFLVLVMRHAGLCVKRQYAAFAGVANGGEKCNHFFDKLVRREFATATPCIHARARLYHVHHKPLYHAIGEADSRYRRTVSARQVADRLMRLDAVLDCPNLEWLTTRAEKLAYLQSRLPSASVGQPSNTWLGQSSNLSPDSLPDAWTQCPGTFPIGLDPTGRLVVLYLARVPWTDDFRMFLVGHTALLSVASSWTVRVVVPQPLRRAVAAYQAVAAEEFDHALDANTIRQLRHYFFHRRRETDLTTIPGALAATLRQYADWFSGPRFTALYHRWLTEHDAALIPIPATMPQALASGRALVECTILPHTYEHLSPVVSRPHVRRRRRPRADEGGDMDFGAVNPSLNLHH